MHLNAVHIGIYYGHIKVKFFFFFDNIRISGKGGETNPLHSPDLYAWAGASTSKFQLVLMIGIVFSFNFNPNKSPNMTTRTCLVYLETGL